ncbi:MAG: N-acetylmuramoyl-L-alanine amidase family protein [Fibrobacterota bacterium]
MKYVCIILLCVTAVFGSEAYLVGLSGRVYTISQMKIAAGAFVSPMEISQRLYLNSKKEGERFVLTDDGDTLILDPHKDCAFIGRDTISGDRLFRFRSGTLYMAFDQLIDAFDRVTSFSFTRKKDTIFLGRDELDRAYPEVTGLVVIDPGHGGRDPGAIGPDSTLEKDVVLALSLHLKDYLSQMSGITVKMTRDDDRFIPLMERTAMANSHGADLFVSIHANASPNKKQADGFKLYFLSEAETEMDREIARQENAVIEYEESEDTTVVNSILSDMIGAEYLKESQELSIQAVEFLDRNVNALRRLHTGVGQANFYVLRGAEMPAVLVESAFISNSREEKLLKDSAFQRRFSRALGGAVIRFMKQYGGIYE